MPFPGTLFNKTVESNYQEILGWFAPIRERWKRFRGALTRGAIGLPARAMGRLVGGPFGVIVFTAATAVVYGFLSPGFGLNSSSAAMYIGLLIGLFFIILAFDLPLRLYHRRRAGEAGRLAALWWTLLVAAICVAVSRLADFQPGYLYGLIVSIVFTTELTTRDEGIGVWLASIWLLLLSIISWVLLDVARQAGGDPWILLMITTVLATFVVAGVETLVVGLLPMRFLPGRPLYEWRRLVWFLLFAASVFAYIVVIVDPRNGALSNDRQTPMVVGVIFLIAFGTVSIGTWAYFRFRPDRGRPETADRPGEEPEPG